jgi:hypothetical protein
LVNRKWFPMQRAHFNLHAMLLSCLITNEWQGRPGPTRFWRQAEYGFGMYLGIIQLQISGWLCQELLLNEIPA